MSRTAEGDGAHGGEHGETAAEEPDPVGHEETEETAVAESEPQSEPDPAALRCGITLGER